MTPLQAAGTSLILGGSIIGLLSQETAQVYYCIGLSWLGVALLAYQGWKERHNRE